MLFTLQTPFRQYSAQQTLLSRVRDAVCFKRALMFFLLLMFVGNCQALMQGQVEFEQSTESLKASSVAGNEHDCCPDDKALEDCQSCLDESVVKPRMLELNSEQGSELWLFCFFLVDSLGVSYRFEPQALQAPPDFSSYPAIYLTQLQFLE